MIKIGLTGMAMPRIVLISMLVVFLPAQAFSRATEFTPAVTNFTEPNLPSDDVISDDEPVVLTADQVDYLQKEDVVVALGNVEIVQDQTVALADQVIYDRKNGTVRARGNVSVMDASGTVMFADEVELRDTLLQGVMEFFRARLSDDSLFAARRAERVDEQVMNLENVTYSPCKVTCMDELAPQEDPHAPMWQIRAKKVTIDQKEQEVVYDDAWMELYGVPVFYTPYLSHATPGADGRSGIMTPEYERSDILGNIYRMPVYYAIAKDKDLVVTPIYTSKEGLVMRGTYRQKFNQGDLDIDTSITRARERDIAGHYQGGHEYRGHFFALGNFDIDDDSRWGFDIKRTTDDTYLRKYEIDGQILLRSRGYVETFDFLESSDRNFLGAEAIAFQGLAAGDNPKTIPLVLPNMNFSYESDPGRYGSRYFIDSNAMMLTRDVGARSRRLANTVGWKVPYITDDGQVFEFSTQVRGDIYDVSDVALSNGKNYNGITGRLVPEASLSWRYPFINQMDDTTIILEPVVTAAISPGGGNPESIPNEDSLVPEFTDSNLFTTNRFAGYDRIEQGPRISYGMRGLANYKNVYVDWLAGQHYRVNENRNFPFSNDLSDNLSDYVGKVGVQYDTLYFAYRFRRDKDTLEERRREFDLSYSSNWLTLSAAYLLLENDPIFASREEVVANGILKVTDRWSIGGGVRKDLLIDQLTNVGGELIYENECVNISGVIQREYTRDREVKPNTSYLVRVSLKNLN